mmetsp:Transcript_11093/g.29405  ORF Transcript_11093/g.29405 Transcript_11093/m.29405 type:complete len:270 (+) Transcript_11093:164-973(+)
MVTPIGCLDTARCFFFPQEAASGGRCVLASSELEASPVLADDGFPPTGVLFFASPPCDEDGQPIDMDRGALEQLLGCRYANFLLFETEADLRGRGEWAYAPPVSPDRPFGALRSSKEMGCDDMLRTGSVAIEFLCVRRVGVVDGVDVGLGLFARRPVLAGTFLGEYTGVVRRRKERDDSSYGYAMPVVDPDLVICAAEYGNLCRLINHSDDAFNSEFVSVYHDGLPHVVCRTLRDLDVGEQVLVHYGDRYWSSPDRQRVRLEKPKMAAM